MARTLMLIAGLMIAAATLSGCVVVPAPGYYPYGGAGWHHGDWDDR